MPYIVISVVATLLFLINFWLGLITLMIWVIGLIIAAILVSAGKA